MKQATIRLAKPEDVDALIALERGTATAAHWSRGQYDHLFSPEAPARICLVGEGGEIHGFLVARTAGPEWELENIAVAPAARRQGLGSRLVLDLLQRARRQHAQAVLLEVRASNVAARALYQSCGFTQAGWRLRYYQEPQEDAIICRFNLNTSE